MSTPTALPTVPLTEIHDATRPERVAERLRRADRRAAASLGARLAARPAPNDARGR